MKHIDALSLEVTRYKAHIVPHLVRTIHHWDTIPFAITLQGG